MTDRSLPDACQHFARKMVWGGKEIYSTKITGLYITVNEEIIVLNGGGQQIARA